MGFPAANDYANAATQGARKTAFENFLAAVKRLLGGADETNVAIAAGAITPTTCSVKVDTEGGAASDDLDTPVWTNLDEGMTLRLRCTSAARPIRIRHNTGAGPGKFQMADGQHLLLDDPEEFVEFVRDGTDAREVAPRVNRMARVQTVTADLTLVPSDCGKTFENTGAAGLVNLTLDDLPVGFWFRLSVRAAQNLRATADAGETIREAATVSGAGGFIQSNVVGDEVLIMKDVAAGWVVLSESPGAAWAVT
jgi:hypothetical protein